MSVKSKREKRLRRKLSTRDKIKGTAHRPRLCVFKSNTNFYAQVVNDEQGVTLCSVSTVDKDLGLRGKKNKEVVVKLGEMLGKKAVEQNIKRIVFDRNGYVYSGIVKEFADACRSNGLEF